jgi:LPS export ABC transporter protein LptC
MRHRSAIAMQSAGVSLRRFHVRILRSILITLIVVVSIAVALSYFQSLRRRRQLAKPAAQILTPDLLRSADTLEYNEWERGILKFRVRAKKLLETKQGKKLLEGIEANNFNPDGSVHNTITSHQGAYDVDRKQMLFAGDVRLYLARSVEVHTESLSYDIGSQSGTSDDRMQFFSPRATGTGRGVRYDNANRELELLQDVSFVIQRPIKNPDESAKIEEYRLTAQRGVYSEQENLIRLLENARVVSAAGTLAGDRIDAFFTSDKRHITSLSSSGHAVYESTDQGEVRTIRGDQLDFVVGEESLVLESIHSLGQAGFSLTSANGDQNLSSEEFLLTLDPIRNLPLMIQSQRKVHFEFVRQAQKTEVAGEWLEAVFVPGSNTLERMLVREHATMKLANEARAPDELQGEIIRISFQNLEGRSVPRELQAEKSVQWKSPGQNASEPGRSLTASALTMRYNKTGEALESGNASGGVILTALPKPGSSNTQLRRLHCDRADFTFYPANNRLQKLTGQGNVKVVYSGVQAGAQGQADEFQTTSSSIQATFREADGGTEALTQTGDFSYRDSARSASSGSCDFSAATDMLVLRDHPGINEVDYSATGDVIQFDRKNQILSIQKNVRAILKPSSGNATGFMTASTDVSSPTVITSDEMSYWKELDKSLYRGNVFLLSAESQLQSQTLLILNRGERIEAEVDVRHRMSKFGDANERKPIKETPLRSAKKDDKAKAGGPVLIRSARLQYSRAENTIHYERDVSLDSADAKMWADTMDVFLDAGGKNVERAKSKGNLKITQPGREVRGQEGNYIPAEGKFIVTGNPARLNDKVKGDSSARQLTFYTTDDRIEWER